MIKHPLHKILFIDIETVGVSSNYENFKKDYPELHFQFINYLDWFKKRFPEDSELSLDEILLTEPLLFPNFQRLFVFQ
jgi:hypothetical protein